MQKIKLHGKYTGGFMKFIVFVKTYNGIKSATHQVKICIYIQEDVDLFMTLTLTFDPIDPKI